jgi:hypothetical protein
LEVNNPLLFAFGLSSDVTSASRNTSCLCFVALHEDS